MPRKKKEVKEKFTFSQFVVVVIILAFLIIFLGKYITEEPEPTQMQDFSSTEQGTFTATLQSEYPKEPIDQVVVLFASSRIPGLMLVYYPYERRLVGGTPQMVIENVVFFDGQPHQLIYSFQKDGQQVIAYDGTPIAASDFIYFGGNAFTGLVTGLPEVVVSDGFSEVEIS